MMKIEGNVGAEARVSRLVEPGEAIIWAGSPDREAMLAPHRRRFWLRVALTPVLLVATVWLASRTLPAGVLESISLDVLLEPRALIPVGVLVILVPLAAVLQRRRLRRYVDSLTYAITDRRLFVAERGEIVDEYRPEQLGVVHRRRRSRGFDDVIFGRQRPVRSGSGYVRDVVQREREQVGFKALRDAESIERTIEAWVASHQRQAESASADFLEAVEDNTAPPEVEPGIDDGSTGTPGVRYVVNYALGLRIDFPDTWRIRVRRKKKPTGRVFFDNEQWREPDGNSDWNVVAGEGPMRCSVEVEVFETAPTASYEELSNNRLASTLRGAVVDADRIVEINSLRGFAITRRNDVQMTDGVTATLAQVVTLQRDTVLYDGRRQVWIKSTWPEESEALGQVVDGIVRSTRLV